MTVLFIIFGVRAVEECSEIFNNIYLQFGVEDRLS